MNFDVRWCYIICNMVLRCIISVTNVWQSWDKAETKLRQDFWIILRDFMNFKIRFILYNSSNLIPQSSLTRSKSFLKVTFEMSNSTRKFGLLKNFLSGMTHTVWVTIRASDTAFSIEKWIWRHGRALGTSKRVLTAPIKKKFEFHDLP